MHNSCKVDILRNGKKGTTVTVGSKKEANSLLNKAFPDYQKVAGVGPQDASGFRKAAKMRAFAKGGTYHKDYAMEVVDGIKKVRGHDIADPHSLLPHINIKRRDGVKVAILISNGK